MKRQSPSWTIILQRKTPSTNWTGYRDGSIAGRTVYSYKETMFKKILKKCLVSLLARKLFRPPSYLCRNVMKLCQHRSNSYIFQDYSTYLLHRLYHTPFLYKNFHKLHHKYTHPTAFSVTAIHPVESVHIQMTLLVPIFTIPVHWGKCYLCTRTLFKTSWNSLDMVTNKTNYDTNCVCGL